MPGSGLKMATAAKGSRDAGRTTTRPPWVVSFRALVATQFLGAFNDNFYKMIVTLIAIDAGSAQRGSAFLSLSGIVFVLPYLLFCGYAGAVADGFAKRSVLILTKAIEIALGVVVIGALALGRVDVLIATLFLLAAQATFFSPAKYGILPEMLPVARLSQANGVLEFSRYLAVILGTVAGGWLLAVWRAEPVRLGAIVLAVALIGWLASLGISAPPRAPAPPRPTANPASEILRSLQQILRDRALGPVVAATTCFDFLTTLMMMDLLLLAKFVIGLDDAGTALLAAVVGLGIGVGSLVAGRLSGNRVELALVPIGATAGALMTLVLSCSVGSLEAVFLASGGLGFFGGFCIVPLYAALQRWSSEAERGRALAANNFLNMAGVLAASGGLWLMHDGIGLSPQSILALCGLLLLGAIGVALHAWPQMRARLRVRFVLAAPWPNQGGLVAKRVHARAALRSARLT
jgi:acyl-[acyl-carrier-protein]-phospholipid O-acyltransferase/long-chain-fatty-acid--[acyl-carrier-protein] ligase